MKAIIAVNNLHYIGLNGVLPWRSKEDLKHFKKLTADSIVLVGYNTHQKLPKLKGRIKVVDDREVIPIESTYKDVWCIGGAKTYKKYEKYFTEVHISYINDNTIGDTFAPNLNLNKDCKVFKYYFDSDHKENNNLK